MSKSNQNPAAKKPTSREENSASVENTDVPETKLSTGVNTGMAMPDVLNDVTVSETKSTSVRKVKPEYVHTEIEATVAAPATEVFQEHPAVSGVRVVTEAEVTAVEGEPVPLVAEVPVLGEEPVASVTEVPLLEEESVAPVIIVQ